MPQTGQAFLSSFASSSAVWPTANCWASAPASVGGGAGFGLGLGQIQPGMLLAQVQFLLMLAPFPIP